MGYLNVPAKNCKDGLFPKHCLFLALGDQLVITLRKLQQQGVPFFTAFTNIEQIWPLEK